MLNKLLVKQQKKLFPKVKIGLKILSQNSFFLIGEIFNNKKLGESGQADRFWGAGGSPHPQPDRFYL